MAEYTILSHIDVSCQSCKHAASLSQRALEPYLGSLMLPNIMDSAHRFTCTECGQRQPFIKGPKGHPYYDAMNIHPCWSCEGPIALARIAAQGSTVLCVQCQDMGEQPPTAPDWPFPKAEFAKCPRCKSPTEYRKNGATGDFFLGCKAFADPDNKCFWASDVDQKTLEPLS